MFERLEKILKKYSTTTIDIIYGHSILSSDLGLSSFEVVAIVNDIEDEFDIEIPDEDISNFFTVQDILEYIHSKIEA